MRHDCPKCGELQFPSVNIAAVANQISYHTDDRGRESSSPGLALREEDEDEDEEDEEDEDEDVLRALGLASSTRSFSTQLGDSSEAAAARALATLENQTPSPYAPRTRSLENEASRPEEHCDSARESEEPLEGVLFRARASRAAPLAASLAHSLFELFEHARYCAPARVPISV